MSHPVKRTSDSALRLKEAAAAAAAWEVVPRPTSGFSFMDRVRAARRKLLELERELARHPVPEMTGDPAQTGYRAALLELGASHRLLRSALGAVADRPRAIARLPRVVLAPRQEEPRAATVAAAYLGAVDGVFYGPSLADFVRAVQEHEPLQRGRAMEPQLVPQICAAWNGCWTNR